MGIVLATGRPTWFAALWIALGTVWMVTRLRRTRRIWSHPSRSMGSIRSHGPIEVSARTVPFELTDDEQAVFGVRHLGDTVVIGPGISRLLMVLAAPAAVAVVAVWFAAGDAAPFATVLALIVMGAAVATGAAFRREGVTLTPEGLSVQGLIGDPRNFEWPDVIDVVIDERNGHQAGVLHVVGEPAIELSTLVADAVPVKVALIARYRTCVHAR